MKIISNRQSQIGNRNNPTTVVTARDIRVPTNEQLWTFLQRTQLYNPSV
jgi:hypothetical protein